MNDAMAPYNQRRVQSPRQKKKRKQENRGEEERRRQSRPIVNKINIGEPMPVVGLICRTDQEPAKNRRTVT